MSTETSGIVHASEAPSPEHTGPPESAAAQAGNPRNMLTVLGGVALLSGLLIALSYQVTLPRILLNQQRALEAAIFNVLPGATSRATFVVNDMAAPERVDEAPPAQAARLYAGFDDAGTLVGIAIEARGQGYADVIRILYGYDPARQIVVGYQVLQSKETPGLGDKIIHDRTFLQNFEALDVQLDPATQELQHPVTLVKQGEKEHPWEIDGLSGATISAKAVSAMLQDSATQWLPYIQQHLQAFVPGENDGQ